MSSARDSAGRRREAFEALIERGRPLVAFVSGGGSGFISGLAKTPGASAVLLEAGVPYHPRALAELLGAEPSRAVAADTAGAMAMAAWQRARALLPEAAQPFGLACTAALASNRPRRGPQLAYLAMQTATETRSWRLQLDKGRRSRAEEESLLVDALLALAAGRELRELREVPLASRWTQNDRLTEEKADARPGWRELLNGELEAVPFSGNPDAPRLLFPGAFNPLHRGHLRMVEVAAARRRARVAFELSVFNVDKPPLDYLEITKRGEALSRHGALWLTRAPTFAAKARLFPGVTFLVGADTLQRIDAPRYHGDSLAARDRALDELAEAGCRFLVFGRLTGKDFLAPDALRVSPRLRRLTEAVPERDFRVDISSTRLRRAARRTETD